MTETSNKEAEHRSGEWIGTLDGIVVREPATDADGAIVELHGEDSIAATEIASDELVDELSHMAAEVQLVLEGVDQ